MARDKVPAVSCRHISSAGDDEIMHYNVLSMLLLLLWYVYELSLCNAARESFRDKRISIFTSHPLRHGTGAALIAGPHLPQLDSFCSDD